MRARIAAFRRSSGRLNGVLRVIEQPKFPVVLAETVAGNSIRGKAVILTALQGGNAAKETTFCKDSASMISRDTLYQLKEERLQILFGKISLMYEWTCASLRASFWRCYCPLDPGGVVIYYDRPVPMYPGRIYIIPPLTDFRSRNEKPFTKAFSHFSYSVPNVSFSPGIYEISLPEYLCAEVSGLRRVPPDSLTAELLMLQLVSLGLGKMPPSARKELTSDPRIQGLVQLMQNEPSATMNNSEIADHLGLTIPSMIRLFKSCVGTSPQQYLKTLRLQHAGILLVHSEKSLEEIAEICGFWDRNHFTRAFTSLFQCPPATYRKVNRT